MHLQMLSCVFCCELSIVYNIMFRTMYLLFHHSVHKGQSNSTFCHTPPLFCLTEKGWGMAKCRIGLDPVIQVLGGGGGTYLMFMIIVSSILKKLE